MIKKNFEKGVTTNLANRALSIKPAILPDDAFHIAKHCMLDWLSLVLASWREPGVVKLHRYLTETPTTGRSTLLGSGVMTSVMHAALLNGMAGHTLDFDDAHLPSRVHPSVPLWPAILAWCEHSKLSGENALAAFVAGIEVQSRLAQVMGESHYRLGWHNTATLGSFGATASVAVLRGLSHLELCNAFGIAASQSGGLRAAFGTSCKPLHAGRASANGIFAAGLAQSGFDAEPAIFDVPEGFQQVYADEVHLESAIGNEDKWHYRDVVFKYHASCYGTQAPIEAALAVAGSRVDSVSSVCISVEPQYLTVCNISEPTTAAQARFSVSHMVALALEGADTASQNAFSNESLFDPKIVAWRKKIYVKGDSSLKRANASIELTNDDGSSNRIVVDASKPEPDIEKQLRRLKAKSIALLQTQFAVGDIERLHDRVLGFEDVEDVSLWMQEFREWSTCRKAI